MSRRAFSRVAQSGTSWTPLLVRTRLVALSISRRSCSSASLAASSDSSSRRACHRSSGASTSARQRSISARHCGWRFQTETVSVGVRAAGVPVFKFFLVDEHGDVQDPAGFLTAVPNWTVGETFLLGRGEKFRILEIRTDLLPEMLDAGFNGIFVVESSPLNSHLLAGDTEIPKG
jgi:hypothetical protein